MTAPASPVQDAVKAITRAAIYKAALPKLAARAIAKAPWLGVSFVNPIFMFALEWLIDVFYDEGILFLLFGVTDYKVGKQLEKFEEEKVKLADKINEVIKQEGELTDEELQKISDDFDKRLGDLINYDT